MTDFMADTPNTRIAWNDTKMLSAAGPKPDNVRQLLLRQGLPAPEIGAVHQWRARRRIAHAWRPMLLYALAIEGRIKLKEAFKVLTDADPVSGALS
ncbi:MAG: hypothetical protein AAGK37_19335 [Pseudomonadota bacterium]